MVKEGKKRPGLKPKIIKDKIIFREPGKTGIRLPVINMGLMNADNPTILKKAYEAGIRHFDTAWGYQNGRNEIMVGNVIKEPEVRDKVIIATKIPTVPKKMTLKLGRHGPFHDAENQSGVWGCPKSPIFMSFLRRQESIPPEA